MNERESLRAFLRRVWIWLRGEKLDPREGGYWNG